MWYLHKLSYAAYNFSLFHQIIFVNHPDSNSRQFDKEEPSEVSVADTVPDEDPDF